MRSVVPCHASRNHNNDSNGLGDPEKEQQFEPNVKYSEQDEVKLIQWIKTLTGNCPNEVGQQGFYEWLKDGQVLSQLMNQLVPGAYVVNPPSKSRLPAKRAMFERENINFFIQAARSYGVPIQDLFQIPYLYDQENMYQVQLTLVIMKGIHEGKSGKL
ncbi:unnamed protein product [Clavelina lepadiformis]|uniref:Calponin-homology (CH) domain-containing protein n=1 Tax=Clavelina lepadiformis TaxID=159417 RepID=A0ABP0FED9_CLALP